MRGLNLSCVDKATMTQRSQNPPLFQHSQFIRIVTSTIVTLAVCLCVGLFGSCSLSTVVPPKSSPQLGPWLVLWQQALRQHPELPAQWSSSTSSQPPGSSIYLAGSSVRSLAPEAQAWTRVLSSSARWRRHQGQLQFRMLVEKANPTATFSSVGFVPTLQRSTFAVGWLPLSQLSALLHHPDLRAAELTTRLRSHLNVSSAMIQAPETRLKYGLDGRGVIVGIIDTGIDYTHPAFRHADGSTRILSLLDYSLRSPFTQTFPQVFNQEQIDQALTKKEPLGHEDTLGHGTHIAGIAAGNGRTNDPSQPARYLGIAPRADLLVVKGLREGSDEFDSGDILQGVAFVHSFAKRVGKPYVINLSLGGQQGGHDGYSLLERALSSFSGPKKSGQILVASAGNEGNSTIHAGGWLRDSTASLRFQVPESSAARPSFSQIVIEMWVPQDSQLKVSLHSPQGENSPTFALDDPPQSLQSMGQSWATFGHSTHNKPVPSRRLSVVITNRDEQPIPTGLWTLKLQGRASRFDAWITETTIPGGRRATWTSYNTQEMLIGIPASTDAVITVGSFNTRSGWKSSTDNVQQREVVVGQLSAFSSPGPTRDQRPKPEVVAPGLFVAAPASSFSSSGGNAQVAGGGSYLVSQGTSQAAPHVTGGIALLLQAAPSLDTDTIRNLLIRSATTDNYTQGSTTYRKDWGFGKFNIFRAAQTQQQPSTQPLDPKRSTVGLLQEQIPADGSTQTYVYILPKDKDGTPLAKASNVEVESSYGSVSPAEEISPGLYRATITAPSEPSVSIVSARVDGVTLHAFRVLQFADAGKPPGQEGCGCQSSSPRFTGLFWLALGILVVFERFRRRKRLHPRN
ncbi:MAG: hypothetical protein EP343_05040 [Deltaproteobacteria bacterium]|nr:MAG: hypothetical protein EP343_05040 [Deltaproteobacteria bacterium]